jgi:long-chain fatty acid transport protein
MGRHRITRSGLAVALCWALASGGEAVAGGSYIPDVGARALGRAGAFVVGADDLMALHYNPAALTKLKKTSFFVDLALVGGDVTFQRAPGIYRRDGTPVDPDVEFPEVENQGGYRPIPAFLIGSSLEALGCEECAVAFGLYGPYNAAFKYPQDGPQRYAVTESGSTQVMITAAFARPISRWLKLGLSGSAVYMGLIQDLMFQANPDGVENRSQDLMLSANLGDWTWTWGAGVIVQPVRWFELGASHQAKIPFTVKGNMTASTLDRGLSIDLPAHTNGAMPAISRMGALVRPLPDLEIEADLVRYHWSVFDEFVIEFGELPFNFELPPVVLTNNYQDVWNPRLGIEYKGLGHLRLRAGTYWESAVIPPETLTPSAIDGQKRLISAGLTYDFGSWDLDLAVARLSVDPRETDRSLGHMINLNGPSTTTGNGRYESSATLLAVGIHFYPGRDRDDR